MQSRTDAVLDDEDEIAMDVETGTGPGNFAVALSPEVDVALVRRGRDLVVGFASRELSDPVAALAHQYGWSFLGIVADQPRDLRSEGVSSFFDALVDGTTLDAFDSVTFVGSGGWAKAALGYALCAPGARIVALDPPGCSCRSGRYPVSPEHLAVAAAGYLVHDPRDAEATAAAQALAGGPMVALPLRIGDGSRLDALAGLGALAELLSAAVDGRLDSLTFFRLLRARRDHAPYLRRLAARMEGEGRGLLAAILMRHAGRRFATGRDFRRFREIEATLARRRAPVPPARG